MQPLLALDMEEAKAWGFLLSGALIGIGTLLGIIITGIQNYLNSKKLDVAHTQRVEAKVEAEEAKTKAEEAKVVIDKTLKNTNGGMHKMVKEVSSMKDEILSLKEEILSLKAQNLNLKHDATVKQDKERAKARPSPKNR